MYNTIISIINSKYFITTIASPVGAKAERICLENWEGVFALNFKAQTLGGRRRKKKRRPIQDWKRGRKP